MLLVATSIDRPKRTATDFQGTLYFTYTYYVITTISKEKQSRREASWEASLHKIIEKLIYGLCK